MSSVIYLFYWQCVELFVCIEWLMLHHLSRLIIIKSSAGSVVALNILVYISILMVNINDEYDDDGDEGFGQEGR